MKCPNCSESLRTIAYEGIEIETCEHCGGEWLDAGELGKITQIREVRFDPDERRAIAEATAITPVKLDAADRDLPCPKCNGTTDALNYGGDTGIVIDRCTECKGLWLDGAELENIQMVIEGWDDALPEDLQAYGVSLRSAAKQVDAAVDAKISRLPLIGQFINCVINGILDFT